MKILRVAEVADKIGLAKSTVYKMMGNKEFPKPISLGAKAVGWLESDVNNWIEQRIKQSANDNTTEW